MMCTCIRILGAEASLNSDSVTLIIKTKNRRPAKPASQKVPPNGNRQMVTCKNRLRLHNVVILQSPLWEMRHFLIRFVSICIPRYDFSGNFCTSITRSHNGRKPRQKPPEIYRCAQKIIDFGMLFHAFTFGVSTFCVRISIGILMKKHRFWHGFYCSYLRRVDFFVSKTLWISLGISMKNNQF